MNKKHHQILETDYDNFALVYGCDDMFFGLFHFRYATLLSRSMQLDQLYLHKAHRRLEDLDYEYPFWWEKIGEPCGIDADKTHDDLFLEVLSVEPDWTKYAAESANTKRVKELFNKSSNHLPSGPITGPIDWDHVSFIKTPFKR